MAQQVHRSSKSSSTTATRSCHGRWPFGIDAVTEALMELRRGRGLTMVTRKSRAEIDRSGRRPRRRRILDIPRRQIRPGVSTAHLDALAEAHPQIRGDPVVQGLPGDQPAGRSRPACISIDDEIVHGISGERTIRAGQIVSVDAGAIADGWHGGARTFYVGDPPLRGPLSI
jgi:hypothetical protein